MMEAEKSTRARVAVGLLCALAVCCGVMYLSADGAAELVREEDCGNPPCKVESADVIKANQIYTNTPRGRESLMTYFTHVEKEISTEVAERKNAIAEVRAIMAKDMAFNAAARAKLKRNMLHQMAKNAKIARDNLNRAMRKTQATFARQADLANRRYAATQARDKATLAAAEEDKRQNAKQLKMATQAWQKSTQAWAAQTNAKIDRMNKHVAANAAAIKENAKKARKDLESMTAAWDHSVATFRSTEASKNAALKEQFAAQDKATRAWANNKIKGLIASTAAQFNDVETKLAKNRAEVDMALKQAVARFAASLTAARALEDKRYAENVANIAAMKKEAADKTAAAASGFKVALLSLSSEVKRQVSKVNERIDKTAGVVRSNAAAQAKVNANVNAEMARMVKLGNENYKKHLSHDAELQAIANKNKADVDNELNNMAADFNNKLAAVRKTLAEDRKHNEDQLSKSTDALYKQLADNEAYQAKKNADMEAATARMRLDAMDNLRKAKAEFKTKIDGLAHTVAENDKKANDRIEALAGVERANAQKSLEGRQTLAALEQANKNELHASIHDAIAAGEKAAADIVTKGMKMDKDSKTLLTLKLNQEITHLREETNASVESLKLNDKKARDEMKKEMLYAIRSAAKVAKADLEQAIKDGEERMEAFQKKADDAHAKSELERAALDEEVKANAADVSRMIQDALAADAKAQASLRQETQEAIKATNMQVDAYARQMEANAVAARADIKALTEDTLNKISKQQDEANTALKEHADADAARRGAALKFMRDELAKAAEQSDAKFGAAYAKMAEDRAHADSKLGAAMSSVNDALAKQAALEDTRFKDSVADIAAARKAAKEEVKQLRKEFGTELLLVTAEAKNTETKITGLLEKVTGEVMDAKEHQFRVNQRVQAEIERIEKLQNHRHSVDKRARGAIRKVMDENKVAAAAEVHALRLHLEDEVAKTRAKAAHDKRDIAKDLSEATEAYYTATADFQKANDAANAELQGDVEAAKLAAATKLQTAEKRFEEGIVGLTNKVAQHANAAERQYARLTGVVNDYNTASEADRLLIKEQIKTVETDLNKALDHAITVGEAKAKAVQQRIAMHLDDAKRYLTVELNESVERAADNVLKLVEGKRSKIADNYLSLKAYAVAASDSLEEYVAKGKGRALSSLGDMVNSIALMGAVHPVEASGIGAGGDVVPAIFSGETLKVESDRNIVNGLVNEYTELCSQIRERWPMGLGKYLMTKLKHSMTDKGVLQVDKIEGSAGQFVFINGRSVGLSNKMDDFAKLAVKLSTYEATLAKLTSKIAPPSPQAPAEFYVKKSDLDTAPWPGK